MENKLMEITNLETETMFHRGEPVNRMAVVGWVGEKKGVVFGTVGRQYRPISYADAYARVSEWLEESKLQEEYYNRNLSRGVLNIELPGAYSVNDQEIKTYINISNSLNGESPLGIYVSPVRVICQNTFILMKRNAFINLSYRHTNKGLTMFNQEIKIVSVIENVMKGQLQLAEQLAKKKITTQKGIDFLEKLTKGQIVPKGLLPTVQSLWENPIRKEDESRNIWTLFNAITDPLNRELESKHRLSTFENIIRVGEAVEELAGV